MFAMVSIPLVSTTIDKGARLVLWTGPKPRYHRRIKSENRFKQQKPRIVVVFYVQNSRHHLCP